MNIILERYIHGDKCTIGRLMIDGVAKWATLEPPQFGHPHRIPEGVYDCSRFQSPHNGQCYLLANVPDFSMVEIHCGNFPRDTRGCILIGRTVAPDYESIGDSRNSIAQLFDVAGHDFTLEIKNI